RGKEPEPADRRSLTRAEGLLAGAALNRPSPAANQALGRLYLVQHDYDAAIAQFESALKADPANAPLQSDLGAALLEKGKLNLESDQSGRSRELLASALGPLNRAIELDPSMQIARFNRALCRQYLELFDLAEEDWNAYLGNDNSSPWANEAREKLDELRKRRSRASVDERLLNDEFAVSFRSANRSEAENLLNEAEVGARNIIFEHLVGRALAEPDSSESTETEETHRLLEFAADVRTLPRSGKRAADSFFADTARACLAKDPNLRPTMRKGRELLEQANRSLVQGNGKSSDTTALYQRAILTLQDTGSKAQTAYAR